MKRNLSVYRFLFVALFCSLPLAARAQWTVYDPSVYAEEIENYGQMYNANQTLLQQFQTAVQQYNMLNAQFHQLTDESRYITSANYWLQAPLTVDSQGRLGGWMTTVNVGGYSNSAAGLNALRYLYAPPTPIAPPTEDQSTRLSLQAASVDLHYNSLEDSLAVIGSIRNSATQNDTALNNLATDSIDQSSGQNTQTALAEKTSIATAILARAQSDTNKALVAQIELQSAQLQQEMNDRAEDLQNRANTAANWTNGNQASGYGSGSLDSTYTTLQGSVLQGSGQQ